MCAFMQPTPRVKVSCKDRNGKSPVWLGMASRLNNLLVPSQIFATIAMRRTQRYDGNLDQVPGREMPEHLKKLGGKFDISVTRPSVIDRVLIGDMHEPEMFIGKHIASSPMSGPDFVTRSAVVGEQLFLITNCFIAYPKDDVLPERIVFHYQDPHVKRLTMYMNTGEFANQPTALIISGLEPNNFVTNTNEIELIPSSDQVISVELPLTSGVYTEWDAQFIVPKGERIESAEGLGLHYYRYLHRLERNQFADDDTGFVGPLLRIVSVDTLSSFSLTNHVHAAARTLRRRYHVPIEIPAGDEKRLSNLENPSDTILSSKDTYDSSDDGFGGNQGGPNWGGWMS